MLAFYVLQVGIGRFFGRFGTGLAAWQGGDAVEVSSYGHQAFGCQYFGAFNQRGLLGALLRQNKTTPRLRALPHHGQCTAHWAQQAGQSQFASQLVFGQFFGRNGDLAGGGEDAHGNRQIETAGFFGQIRRGEIDGDFFGGEVEAALDDGGAHAVAAFFHFGVGQADDIEGGQAVGQVGFHFHQGRGHAAERPAVYHRQTHAALPIAVRKGWAGRPGRRLPAWPGVLLRQPVFRGF